MDIVVNLFCIAITITALPFSVGLDLYDEFFGDGKSKSMTKENIQAIAEYWCDIFKKSC